MRRHDREITDTGRIEAIIAGARYMHLGMMDGDMPYVVPLHYGYLMEDGRLTFYMHSANEGHKLDCLRKNGNVFVEIDRGESLITADTPCAYGASYESVMCRGRAAIVTDIGEKCRALALLMRTQTGEEHEISERMASAVTVIRVDVETYTAKARLMAASSERLAKYDASKLISEEEMNRRPGLTEDDLAGYEAVDIE